MLAPQAVERSPLGYREIAAGDPSAGEWQTSKGSLPAPCIAENPCGGSRSPNDKAAVAWQARPTPASPSARVPASTSTRTLVRGRAASFLAREFASGTPPRNARRNLRREAGGGHSQDRSSSASEPRPSGRHKPSHRHGRRSSRKPGNCSYMRRNGYSAACRETHRRGANCDHCRATRHDSSRDHRDRRRDAARSRPWCRSRIPAPVAERASTLRIVVTSASVGTTFSRLAITICICGRLCVRSPLPSLVTMTELPVSAIRKFAPVMPTSAATYCWS